MRKKKKRHYARERRAIDLLRRWFRLVRKGDWPVQELRELERETIALIDGH